jgi:hypothetical protein
MDNHLLKNLAVSRNPKPSNVRWQISRGTIIRGTWFSIRKHAEKLGFRLQYFVCQADSVCVHDRVVAVHVRQDGEVDRGHLHIFESDSLEDQ